MNVSAYASHGRASGGSPGLRGGQHAYAAIAAVTLSCKQSGLRRDVYIQMSHLHEGAIHIYKLMHGLGLSLCVHLSVVRTLY